MKHNLKIYNTLSRKKDLFRPINAKRVNLFVCGPTVYDYSHLGHARTAIVFDCFSKYLKNIGFNVFYLQNITDLDDKIIARAREKGVTPKDLATAFEKEYLTPNGRLVSGTQTAYTLALNFDMLPASLRQQAADRLVDNIKSYGNHLTTGFLGTPYLCHVLTRFGYTDIAYKLLLQDTYPSWLYPVKMGATTIWERWDGQKPDSSFQTPGMNSFNHYSYGAIGDWMYRQMVGIDTYTDGVGYQHSSIKPHIGGGFTHAAASLQTYYGLLSNEWTITGDSIVMETVIPSNTRSTIFIPSSDSSTITVTESGKPLSIAKTIFTDENAASYVKLELGSGHYRFTVLQSKEVNSRKDLADYAGVYKVEGAMITKIEIRYQKGKLIASIYNNSGDLEPVKTNRDQFTSPDGSTVHFIRDANGQVAKIKMGSLGMVFEGVRQ